MPEKASAPSSLEICVLGPFRVAVDGVPVEEGAWERPTSKLLVQLLSLQPHHQLPRDEVMDMLWPEQDTESATNNLNKAIHFARHALEHGLKKGAGSRFIVTQKKQVILCAPERLWIDADEFEIRTREAIRENNAAACETALALYRGDLLAENKFADWAAPRREHLRLTQRKLVTKLAQLYEEQGEYDRGIKHLQDLLLIKEHATDERAHRQLMRLLALTGSKFLALEQYKQCRETLRRDLDANLEPATIELGRQILHNVIQPAPVKSPNAAATFNRLTSRRGTVRGARLINDGQDVVYAAAWDGKPTELFLRSSAQGVAAPVRGLSGVNILASLPFGRAAILTNSRFLKGYINMGPLAYASLDGSECREILADVQWADYLRSPLERAPADPPRIEDFLLVRDRDGKNCLEFPAGNSLYETSGWVSHPRFSPRGDLIAFWDHPYPADDSGSIVIIDLKGEKRALSTGWVSAQGLAWSAAGDEVWFTATMTGNARAIYAVTLEGQARLVYSEAGSLTLQDISGEGHVLITRDQTQIDVCGLVPGETEERDLTWLDWSLGRDLSDDGQTLLFTEAGEGAGAEYDVYLQNIKDSTVRRLGDGSALALSPDQSWALVRVRAPQSQLMLLPLKEGEPRRLNHGGLNHHPWASWFPDGRGLLFVANEQGRGSRLYVQGLNGGLPQAIESVPEGTEIFSPHSISPCGEVVAAINPDQEINLYPIKGGGAALPVTCALPMEVPIRWAANGKSLYVCERGKIPVSIYRIDLATGARELWKELRPPDPVGVNEVLRILLTPDLRGYAYTYTRDLSKLYLVEGLR